MSLGKSRVKIYARGLGKMEVREVEPTPASDFSNVGYLKSTAISDDHQMEDLQDETGAVVQSLSKGQVATAETQLMQTSYDEWNLIRGAVPKIYAARYGGVTNGGKFQYFVFPNAKINSSVALNYVVGERLLPLKLTGLVDTTLAYDLPPYMMAEYAAEIRSESLHLFIDPKFDFNTGTAYVLDMSGFQRHGTISPVGDIAATWGQADMLRLDGTDGVVSFGDVCNLAATDDFMIELWLRVVGADGSLQEILAKKAASGSGAGFSLVRTTGNKIEAELADGTDHPEVTGGTNVLQNTWHHVALVANRAGNGQLYIDGATDGSAVSLAAVGDMTNALSLELGKLSTGYGQIDVKGFRVYNFGASGLPSDIAAIILRHYSAG